MSDHSVTIILNQLRHAGNDDDRQAAAAKLYQCYRNRVERIARGRLSSTGGLSDEEDVAQSAFRSFFGRIETGQMDALVNGGQAWAILARLTRNKAIDSVRYDNAMCRGGEGARKTEADSTEPFGATKQSGQDRLGLADRQPESDSVSVKQPVRKSTSREEVPIDGVYDQSQRSAEDEVASNEIMERFLEELSEATLRGIVSLKLHGFTNEEIAQKLGCATRTVERKLNLIRRLWLPILEESDEGRSS